MSEQGEPRLKNIERLVDSIKQKINELMQNIDAINYVDNENILKLVSLFENFNLSVDDLDSLENKLIFLNQRIFSSDKEEIEQLFEGLQSFLTDKGATNDIFDQAQGGASVGAGVGEIREDQLSLEDERELKIREIERQIDFFNKYEEEIKLLYNKNQGTLNFYFRTIRDGLFFKIKKTQQDPAFSDFDIKKRDGNIIDIDDAIKDISRKIHETGKNDFNFFVKSVEIDYNNAINKAVEVAENCSEEENELKTFIISNFILNSLNKSFEDFKIESDKLNESEKEKLLETRKGFLAHKIEKENLPDIIKRANFLYTFANKKETKDFLLKKFEESKRNLIKKESENAIDETEQEQLNYPVTVLEPQSRNFEVLQNQTSELYPSMKSIEYKPVSKEPETFSLEDLKKELVKKRRNYATAELRGETKSDIYKDVKNDYYYAVEKYKDGVKYLIENTQNQSEKERILREATLFLANEGIELHKEKVEAKWESMGAIGKVADWVGGLAGKWSELGKGSWKENWRGKLTKTGLGMFIGTGLLLTTGGTGTIIWKSFSALATGTGIYNKLKVNDDEKNKKKTEKSYDQIVAEMNAKSENRIEIKPELAAIMDKILEKYNQDSIEKKSKVLNKEIINRLWKSVALTMALMGAGYYVGEKLKVAKDFYKEHFFSGNHDVAVSSLSSQVGDNHNSDGSFNRDLLEEQAKKAIPFKDFVNHDTLVVKSGGSAINSLKQYLVDNSEHFKSGRMGWNPNDTRWGGNIEHWAKDRATGIIGESGLNLDKISAETRFSIDFTNPNDIKLEGVHNYVNGREIVNLQPIGHKIPVGVEHHSSLISNYHNDLVQKPMEENLPASGLNGESPSVWSVVSDGPFRGYPEIVKHVAETFDMSAKEYGVVSKMNLNAFMEKFEQVGENRFQWANTNIYNSSNYFLERQHQFELYKKLANFFTENSMVSYKYKKMSLGDFVTKYGDELELKK